MLRIWNGLIEIKLIYSSLFFIIPLIFFVCQITVFKKSIKCRQKHSLRNINCAKDCYQSFSISQRFAVLSVVNRINGSYDLEITLEFHYSKPCNYRFFAYIKWYTMYFASFRYPYRLQEPIIYRVSNHDLQVIFLIAIYFNNTCFSKETPLVHTRLDVCTWILLHLLYIWTWQCRSTCIYCVLMLCSEHVQYNLTNRTTFTVKVEQWWIYLKSLLHKRG